MNSLQIEQLPEFDNHKLISFIFDQETDLHGFIAVHRGSRGVPALGATRFWNYETENDALRDALRLSRMMSYKSALAGLKYGGAKATLIATKGALENREKLFEIYAKKVDELNGRFITGTDVGVTDDDVRLMRKFTKHVIGNKLDPAYFTAVGVLNGIKESLKFALGDDSISGKSFAIQGVGKTGCALVDLIYKDAEKIYITDIDGNKIERVAKKFPKVKIVLPEDIHRQKVDIFVPAALSGALSSKSVSELQCSIVCGSANNQLADSHVGELLNKLKILYAPDYVVNAGGLISVVDEFENKRPSEKRIIKKVTKIRKTLKRIFNQTKKEGKSTNYVADQMAEKIFNNHK
jgi:leucine dehydrogenase